MLFISHRIQVPFSEFKFSFARSSGPGGQNVNKVNSKAILRWAVVTSPSLPDAVRARFLTKYANRLTISGNLVLTSQKYRDQNRNINNCLEKLQEMIYSVVSPPTPRRATKPTKASKQHRIKAKSIISKKKQQRRTPEVED